MENRFEPIKSEIIKFENGLQMRIEVFRDKQSGVMYVSNHSGITALIDKDGKPMTTFKVNI